MAKTTGWVAVTGTGVAGAVTEVSAGAVTDVSAGVWDGAGVPEPLPDPPPDPGADGGRRENMGAEYPKGSSDATRPSEAPHVPVANELEIVTPSRVPTHEVEAAAGVVVKYVDRKSDGTHT